MNTEKESILQELKQHLVKILFFLASAGNILIFVPGAGSFKAIPLLFFITGCILLSSVSLFLLRKWDMGEKKGFIYLLLCGMFFLLLPFLDLYIPQNFRILFSTLPLILLLLFAVLFSRWTFAGTGVSTHFLALIAGFSAGGLLYFFPVSIVKEICIFIKILAPFIPLWILFLCIPSFLRTDRKKVFWSRTLILLFLICGAAGQFSPAGKSAGFLAKTSLIAAEKNVLDEGKVVLAASIGAGQFKNKPVTFYIAGDSASAGYILQKKSFPARVVLAENSYNEHILFDNTDSALPPYSGKADIVFVALKELSFPMDIFLTERVLSALRKKFTPGGGVFIFLLPELDADLSQKVIDETSRKLSRLYANILSISNPKMLLAANLPLCCEPEKLEEALWVKNEEEKEKIFPEGFLQIFTPELSRSRVCKKMENDEKSEEEILPLPFLLQEKLAHGFEGEIWGIFNFWTGVYKRIFFLFWGVFLAGYFIFRYFCSPGVCQKQHFCFFEQIFFLTAMPLSFLLRCPEKIPGGSLLFFHILLPFFMAFFSAALWSQSSGKIPETNREKSRKWNKFFPLYSITAMLLLFHVYFIRWDIFPGGIPFFLPASVFLLMTAGASCGVTLKEILKNMQEKDLSTLLLCALAGFLTALILILPLAYGESFLMIPPAVFMVLLQICVLRKNEKIYQ